MIEEKLFNHLLYDPEASWRKAAKAHRDSRKRAGKPYPSMSAYLINWIKSSQTK